MYLVLKRVDAWQRVGKGHVVSRDSASRQSGDKQSACHWNDNFLETHAFQAPTKGGRCCNRYKRVKTVQIYSTIKIDLITLTTVNKACIYKRNLLPLTSRRDKNYFLQMRISEYRVIIQVATLKEEGNIREATNRNSLTYRLFFCFLC